MTFVPMQGRWRFDGETATYEGADGPGHPVGVCLSPVRFRSGVARVKVELSGDAAARILLGFNARTQEYYSIGLGGYGWTERLRRGCG